MQTTVRIPHSTNFGKGRGERDPVKLFATRLMRGLDKRSQDYGRFGYENLIHVERGEENSDKTVKVVYLYEGTPKTEYLSTKQLTQNEVKSIHRFLMEGKSDAIESFSPDIKPKLPDKPKLSGLDLLEERLRPKAPPISEAVTGAAVVSETKYSPVKIRRTVTVVYEEEFILPMTKKTHEEYLKMQTGSNDDRFVVNHLMKKQLDERKPDLHRQIEEKISDYEILE
jgi:hypothetical protein